MGVCAYQLKFVVAVRGDLDEVERVVAEVGARRECVLLMAEGCEAAVLRERGAWIAEECKRRGYRMSPRLHVELWGSRRGV
jgi:7-carboxy-7-deazaguanine synthase